MARYTGTVEAPPQRRGGLALSRRPALGREWDPSVDEVGSSAASRAGERALRARVSFLGRSINLPYRVIEAEAPHRVVFAAETTRSRSATRPGSSRRGGGSSDLGCRPAPAGTGGSSTSRCARLQRIGDDAEQGLSERLTQAELGADRAGARMRQVRRFEADRGGRSRGLRPRRGAELHRAGHDVHVFEAGPYPRRPHEHDRRRDAGRPPGRSTPGSSSSTSSTTPTSSACWASSGSPRSRRT